MLKIALPAAAFGMAMAVAGLASTPASAGLYDNFCRAGSPTPKYICNTIKAHEKAKPQRAQIQRFNSPAAKRSTLPRRPR